MEEHGVALLLIDTINALDFEGSEGIVRAATRAAPHIKKLAERARSDNVPVIYVNDNFGQWRSDFRATIQACTAEGKPGRDISQRLHPQDVDYFVLKPMHSGFFCTPLELLLEHLGVNTLVITGFAADLCVLLTAHDAHMRGYRLVIPEDCTAANTEVLTSRVLSHARESLNAGTEAAESVDFSELRRKPKRSRPLPLVK